MNFIPNKVSISSLTVSVDCNEETSERNFPELINPVSDIFICFGQEEIFEGDLEQTDHFDITEHLNTLLAQDNPMDQSLGDPHMTAIV